MSLCEQGVPRIEPSELYGEVDGGRDIHPIFDHPLSSDGAPVWEVENEGDGGVKVYAGPMSHGIPCVGYVIQEADRPGRLRDELVKPICQRNIPALKEAGFRHPMKALAVIKDLPEGGSFTFPDGTVVTQEEAVEPTRPGRKVVICGDTNSARGLEKLAENADVLVHEATNTFIPHLDHRDSSPRTVTQEAIFHGHSTPLMAGDFAKRTKAKRLILNHFSARYMADQSLESMSIMTRIEDQAIKASGLDKTAVAAAWDFMIFPIPKPYDKKKSSDNDESEEKNS
jgi:ribonuclease Z